MDVSFGAAEYSARDFLSEVRDSIVIELKEVSNPFHHCSPTLQAEPIVSSYRILVVGDSFTFGFGVSRRDLHSYPARLEALLRESGKDVQIFNLSCFSYSPSIHAAVLNHFLPLIKPDLVIMAVDDSDFQDDYLYREGVIKNQGTQGISFSD